MAPQHLAIDLCTSTLHGVVLPARGLPEPGDIVSVPAVVGFRGGKLNPGEPALMTAGVVADRILTGPLRLVGRGADDPVVQRYADRSETNAQMSKGELRLIPREAPEDAGVGIIEAIASLLAHLMGMLERAHERQAVLAVPAWLSASGRSQLLRAAAQAQLTIRRFVTREAAMATHLAAERELIGRGLLVVGGSGGVSAALVEGRTRSLAMTATMARDRVGADDVVAEITRSIAPAEAKPATCELLRQAATTMLAVEMQGGAPAKRTVRTPEGEISLHLDAWELDLLVGPVHLELADVLDTIEPRAPEGRRRRWPTWFTGPLAVHRALRKEVGDRAQGPLRAVPVHAAVLGALRLAGADVNPNALPFHLDDGDDQAFPPVPPTSPRRTDDDAPTGEPVLSSALRPEAHLHQHHRPPTQTSRKAVTTLRAQTSTRRLTAEERRRRRRERTRDLREARKGPLPVRGGKTLPSEGEETVDAPTEAENTATEPAEAPPPLEPRAIDRRKAAAAAVAARDAKTVPPPAPESTPPPSTTTTTTTGPPRAAETPPTATAGRVSEPPDGTRAPGPTAAPRALVVPGPRPLHDPAGGARRRMTMPQTFAAGGDDASFQAPLPRISSPPPRASSPPPRISTLPPGVRTITVRPGESQPPPPPPPSPRAAGSIIPPGGQGSLPPGAVWPEAGSLRNPDDAASILDLAITREMRVEDLDPIALPVLLRRVLGRAEMVGVLELRAEQQKPLDLPVQDGALLLSRAEHNALRRYFDVTSGKWSFRRGDRLDPAAHPLAELRKLRTVGLDGLRRMLRHTERADLQATFGHRFDEAPRIRPDKARHPHRLRLDRKEVRAVEQCIDGRSTVRALTVESGLGVRATLQVLALLDMFEVLHWPEGDAL
ncbi:MAG: hypothetical protein AAGN82_13000 [Myxococcota bacterium]